MENVASKKLRYNSEKKKCQCCGDKNYIKPSCGIEEIKTKLVKEDSVVPCDGDKSVAAK